MRGRATGLGGEDVVARFTHRPFVVDRDIAEKIARQIHRPHNLLNNSISLAERPYFVIKSASVQIRVRLCWHERIDLASRVLRWFVPKELGSA